MSAFLMTLNTTAESETAKIARVLREKDMQLLADLVERCQHRLVRYLLYLTGRQEYAEDLAQETWIRDRSTGDPDFFSRGPPLGPCSSCGKPIRSGEAFSSHCGCSQVSNIGRVPADKRTI
jgi:hypothetical protein